MAIRITIVEETAVGSASIGVDVDSPIQTKVVVVDGLYVESSIRSFDDLNDTPALKIMDAFVASNAAGTELEYVKPTLIQGQGVTVSNPNIKDSPTVSARISDGLKFETNGDLSVDESVVRTPRKVVAGNGLSQDNPDLTTDITLNVESDRGINVAADKVGIALAANSGLKVGATAEVDINGTAEETNPIGTDVFIMENAAGQKKRVTKDNMLAGLGKGAEIRGTINPKSTDLPPISALVVTGDPLNPNITQGVTPNGAYPSGYLYVIMLDDADKEFGVNITMMGPTGSPVSAVVHDQDQLQFIGNQFTHLATGNAVITVHGRKGVVVSKNSDYTSSQIDVAPTGNLTSTNTQAALEEHQGDIDDINTNKANDDAVVKLVGDQSITGKKTFNGTLEIPNGDGTAGAIRQIRRNTTTGHYEGYVGGVWLPMTFDGDATDYTVLSTNSTTPRTLGDRFSAVVNVKDFGAVGDGVVDDTLACQAALATGRSVLFPSGFVYRITSSLTPHSFQTVWAYGADFTIDDTVSSTPVFWSSTGALDTFKLFGGRYLCDATIESSFFVSNGAFGNGNGMTVCTISDVNVSSVDVGFRLVNARDTTIRDCRIDCAAGIEYIDKCAEVVISDCIFVAASGRTSRHGVWSSAVTTPGISYPEGLSIRDTLFFRFLNNLVIDDIYVMHIIGCYFDGHGQSASVIGSTSAGRAEGIRIETSWFFAVGITFGVGSNTAPKLLRSSINNCHFSAMRGGVDVSFQRFVHGVTCQGNHHTSDNTGTHIGYVGSNSNNNITIDSPKFENYDSYVQFVGSGENNLVCNIVNADNLVEPVSFGYPVNWHMIEGYTSQSSRSIPINNFAYTAGSTMGRLAGISLTAGTHYLTLNLVKFTVTGECYLALNGYTTGTTTNAYVDIILNLIQLNTNRDNIAITIPVVVSKATYVEFELSNLAGPYSSINITSGAFNQMVIS